MGPCECDCPDAILDLLSPTDHDHQYAEEWRARCRDNCRRAAHPVRQTDTTRRPDDHLRHSAFFLQWTAPRPISMSPPIPATTGQSSTAPTASQRALPHQQRQAQTLPASLIQTIHTHNQKPRRDGNRRYGIPPRRAKGRLLAGSRAESASTLSSGAALRTPLHPAPDAGAICHSAKS